MTNTSKRPSTKLVRTSRDSGPNKERYFKFMNVKLTEEQRKTEDERLKKKRETQAQVDKTLLANVKKVAFLKTYLSARFSITKNVRPHELVF